MINVLLEHGLEVDILDDGGKNALHLAIKIGDDIIISTLLGHNRYVSKLNFYVDNICLFSTRANTF